MTERLVGPVSEFDDDHRKVVSVGEREIIVFRVKDRFYALSNVCLHMGGPVGEGRIMGKGEAVLDENKALLGHRFSEEETHLVCPWHGWEYNIETGQCVGLKEKRLRTFETRVRDGLVYVSI